MTEAELLKLILLEAPKHKCVLFRNNVGILKDRYGRRVKYGLTVGSSDLIGWKQVPHLNGEGRAHGFVALFLAVETKGPKGRVSKKQKHFIDYVNFSGGIAGVCRSVEEFIALVE